MRRVHRLGDQVKCLVVFVVRGRSARHVETEAHGNDFRIQVPPHGVGNHSHSLDPTYFVKKKCSPFSDSVHHGPPTSRLSGCACAMGV